MRCTFASAIAAIGSFLFAASAFGQPTGTTSRKGRVREAILEAKAAGHSQIEIPPPLITPTGVTSLSTIAAEYSVIVAQPIQIVTVLSSDGNRIETWYKLRVYEVTSKQPSVPTEPSIEQFAPSDLLPAGSDVLLPSAGGSVTLDGITVTQRSPIGLRLQLNHKYVLAVHLESSGSLASLAALSEGVLEVASDGSLTPMGRRDHPLVTDIYQRTGNKLEFLRKALREQPH